MKNTLQLILAGAVVVVAFGCSSSRSNSATKSGEIPPASESAISTESATLLGLRAELSPAPRLVLKTSGKPAYSSYSPQPDVFVIDLPATTKSTAVSIPSNLPMHVASVAVDEAIELGKPLTRVTVRFTEHFTPVASGFDDAIMVSLGAVTVAEPEPVIEISTAGNTGGAIEVVEIDAAAVDEEPLSGASATVLNAIETSGSGRNLRILLDADGIVQYNSFRLVNPLRLVIDLKGIKNKTKQASVNLGDPYVKRVRVSQFKPAPQAVTRIVLDLDEVVDYKISRKSTGLLVSFGSDAPMPPNEPVAIAHSTATEPAEKKAAIIERLAASYEAPALSPIPDTTNAKVVISSAAMEPAPQSMTTTTQETVPQTDAGVRVSVPQSGSNTRLPENVFVDPSQPTVTAPRDPRSEMMLGSPQSSRVLSPTDRVYEGEPITMTLKDADIKDVLRMFAQTTGLNIAIDPDVSGQVTVEFTDVPWDQAFELILRQNQLTFLREGNVIRVGKLDRLASEQVKQRRLEEEERLNVPLQTIIKPLSYAEAADVRPLLLAMASPRAKIVIDERTNQLIITEIPGYMTTLLNLIETIDIATPQVIIEARVVETTKNFLRNLGIQWGFGADLDPALGTGTGLIFPNRVSAIGGPFRLGAGNPVLSLTLGNVLGTFDLDVILTAAEAEGMLRVVSAPKIQTQDNVQAEIRSGVEIPLQTRVNFTTTISYVDATLRLNVRPHITNDDTVIMRIEIQKTEPAIALILAGSTKAPPLTRRARTTLMVANGATTVIGGIYQATENRGQTRVPFLHEIPIIGNLFKNRTYDTRHDELLIFITPRIVR